VTRTQFEILRRKEGLLRKQVMQAEETSADVLFCSYKFRVEEKVKFCNQGNISMWT